MWRVTHLHCLQCKNSRDPQSVVADIHSGLAWIVLNGIAGSGPLLDSLPGKAAEVHADVLVWHGKTNFIITL